jgi:hypothetical protein
VRLPRQLQSGLEFTCYARRSTDSFC